MKYTLLLALACACLGACHASNDQSPQKVGPKYFFGSDGPVLNLESESSVTTEKPASNEVDPEVDPPMTIRRVFLMPAFTRTILSSSGSGDEESRQDDFPRFMRPPSLMPFLFPQHFMRDFRPLVSGSSSEEPLTAATSSSNSREREETTKDSQHQNPIDLLLEMMTKALRGHAMTPISGQPDESTSSSEGADKSLEKPAAQPTTNETQEEVVTINGKRYLKKSVVYRHFGDNLMFLTRRLIFTPLDEVEGAANATTTEASSASEAKTPTTEVPTSKESTTDQSRSSTTVTSTRVTEETTPIVVKIEPSSTPEKMIESELVKPVVSTEAAPVVSSTATTSEKPTAEATSSQSVDRPIPSSEPDFQRN